MKNGKSSLVKYGKLKPAVTRKYVPLMVDFFASSYADLTSYKKLFLINSYVRMLYLSSKAYYGNDIIEFANTIVSKEEKKQGFINKIFSTIYEFGENLLALSEELKNIDYSNQEIKDLINKFRKFSKLYQTFCITLTGYSIQYPIETRLKKIVENRKTPNEDLSILTFPIKDNFAALEQVNILKIGILVERNKIKKFEDLSVEILEKIQEHRS